MKNILISLPQVEWSCFLASHLCHVIKVWIKENVNFEIIEKNVMDVSTFPYIKGKLKTVTVSGLADKYDLVVNLDPDPLLINFLNSYYENVINASNIIYGVESDSLWSTVGKIFNIEIKEPVFQIEFPQKIKPNKAESGVAIKDENLRMYVKKAFFADNNRLWHIPIRLNLIKRYDECNTVNSIVTDDIFCSLSAYCLKKEVIFLKTKNTYPNIFVENKIYIQDAGNFMNAVNN